jgi:GT2 family glycosyltransferase
LGDSKLNPIGLVAIGRNEGQRLRQCLLSVLGKVGCIVYVDSGSTDGSVEMARSLGVEVVELDRTIPFTAARARNAGWMHLQQIHPHLQFVQFVDGDCEVAEGWLERAQQELEDRPELAVVCGRRRESFPQASIYNRLCDIEWNTPVGEALACGGDSMMRMAALQQVDGFSPTLIAGEEPELCVRLRQKGWKVLRADAEMTRHDARMTHFGQWWKRSLRSGHAFAEGAWLHGKPPERHWVRETRSARLWGAIVPLVAVGMMGVTRGFSVLLLAGYGYLMYRIYRYYHQQRGFSAQDAALYALSCTLSKFPELVGQLQFHANRLLGRRSQLVEYKTAADDSKLAMTK